ncbi:hypothetical protein NP493_2420g00009 [Ridgeia piscesae]|uniref:Uncharacterized protein n=1 Tax=Ridgeia piscesae TaxID=27915 RepID=A0AAD9JGG7_RIDPI|nr:hypothetical protein NP493_2420g00009 [Ridgeia piscesae]
MSLFVICPCYPHDRTQMPRLHTGGWIARVHGMYCL